MTNVSKEALVHLEDALWHRVGVFLKSTNNFYSKCCEAALHICPCIEYLYDTTNRYLLVTGVDEFSFRLRIKMSHSEVDSQKRPLERLAFVQDEENGRGRSFDRATIHNLTSATHTLTLIMYCIAEAVCCRVLWFLSLCMLKHLFVNMFFSH